MLSSTEKAMGGLNPNHALFTEQEGIQECYKDFAKHSMSIKVIVTT